MLMGGGGRGVLSFVCDCVGGLCGVCVWICVRVCVFCKRNATVVGEAAGIVIGGGGGSAERVAVKRC